LKSTALILTHNESRHLPRCIASLRQAVDAVIVVDSGSTDGTRELARELGAQVFERKWKNYADQFNWGLGQVPVDVEWVLRIDADEFLSPELAALIPGAISSAAPDLDGFFVRRGMVFQGRKITHGGLYPIQVLRVFRRGRGACENRWMDEHIKVTGRTAQLDGDLIDENLNSLTWWTDKHNRYASREAVDILNREHHWYPEDTVGDLADRSQASIKRWLKERVYARLPSGWRALAYFLYRYVVRLGFMDGAAGTRFHLLQGFWYRYLVDAKIAEVRARIAATGCAPHEAVIAVLDIDPRGTPAAQAATASEREQ
jgi:glycosyltransferase involved in cell wall biosynthesis